MLEFLDLSGNSFFGEIPSSLHQCRKLKFLNMDNNRIYGHLPSDIGNLSMLQTLSLNNNNLTGSLPQSLFNISTLRLINLRNNFFGGQLPEEMCDQAHSLQHISILNNNVGGTIPKSIGNCTSLVNLYLGANFFTGTIPYEIGDKLRKLEILHLQGNKLTGSIPPNIFNISGLQSLSLSNNNLSGNLPIQAHHTLSNLQFLYISGTNLSGEIPTPLFNASMLLELVLANSSFSGPIPDSFGNLRNLQVLYLLGNNFTGGLGFLNSLTQCRQLTKILLAFNPLGGTLPNAIGNLSQSLQRFDVRSCNIKGEIPPQIGNLKNLYDLKMYNNQFIGEIPSTIGNLQLLQLLDLSNNRLNSSIPEQICRIQSLNQLILSNNNIFGPIPRCVDHLSSLRILYLDSNNLNSTIPSTLGSLSDILEVNLSTNGLEGSLPAEISSMNAVINLDISYNKLSGKIPTGIGSLQRILNLSLAYNMLQGPIPDSIGNMLSLEFLDFSHNLLSGTIPKSFVNIVDLKFINLSYNRLYGEIPYGGKFINFKPQSFMMNDGLCGRPNFGVPPCSNDSAKNSRRSKALKLAIPLIVLCMILACAVILIYRRKLRKGSVAEDLPSFRFPSRISYFELMEATQKFDESNLIGRGGLGSVFRGELSNGTVVAVKVFNLEIQQAPRSFDAECEAMRNLRHRNLVKVISSCSNSIDFKALVMEFVANGNLEQWLYSHNYCLPFMQRLKVVIDVACALEYLHHGNTRPVVHCDLKPSNVLLDEDMVAHVCDFNIAKLLEEGQSEIHTNTLATLGYMAPEYGLEGVVSLKGDVYSYGILLMEVFTRKKPTDEMFCEGLSLRSWIQQSLPRGITEVVDPNLMEGEEQVVSAMEVALSKIMDLALDCSHDSPNERISMKEVFVLLSKIKTTFQQR
nr:receptor kinase-like protein Xa21 [Arachis hypogaea]